MVVWRGSLGALIGHLFRLSGLLGGLIGVAPLGCRSGTLCGLNGYLFRLTGSLGRLTERRSWSDWNPLLSDWCFSECDWIFFVILLKLWVV